MAYGWLTSLRERLFARRIVKRLLKSYGEVRGNKPELKGTDLYREVLVHSGAVGPDEVNRWLDDAEDSVDQWTAPGRAALGLREVAHFLVVSRYHDQGRPGSVVSFASIVNAMIPAHL
jgi:hypothetical protein